MRYGRAFTLIEVLVVIGIISVLAALLFPAFSQAKERARLTQDISQMRQTYLALSLYDQSSDSMWAPSLLYAEPYAKSREIYVSPSDPYRMGIPGIKDFPADLGGNNGRRSTFRISYAYLPPMAKFEQWTAEDLRQHMENPAYGVISLYMYDKPFWWQPDKIYEDDIFRIHLVNDRILVDGSYKRVHREYGSGVGCTTWDCFGVP